MKLDLQAFAVNLTLGRLMQEFTFHGHDDLTANSLVVRRPLETVSKTLPGEISRSFVQVSKTLRRLEQSQLSGQEVADNPTASADARQDG